MAAVQQLLTSPSPGPSPAMGLNGNPASPAMDLDARPSQSPVMLHGRSLRGAPEEGDKRIVVIVYGHGQDRIVSVFAEVLGKPFRLKSSFGNIAAADRGYVIGILAGEAKADVETRDRELVVAINAHCVHLGMPPDAQLSTHCDYEFLYTEPSSFRRYLARFISFVLGQVSHHEELMAKPRTYFMSTTFPDVRAALPNLDILTVGSDAVEIRVDLLREPLGGGNFAGVPSLSYVGEQVMLLRQRTELHRTDPVCANCHKVLDPIGFGLENFDAIGRWRELDDAGGSIDAAGKLPGGEAFTNPKELKQLIAKREANLARNLTERLMAYALCRQLEGYDEIVLDHVMEKIAKDKYRMQTLITEIVTSYLFTQRRIKD